MKGVLVVEDDILNRYLWGEILDQLGHAHTLLETAESCIDELTHRAQEFGHLFLDIHLGGVSGIDLVNMVRRKVPHSSKLEIIAVTGDTRLSETDLASHGFDGVLRKPFEIDEIRALLERG